MKTKDIGNLCVNCYKDTSVGSGRFVNRIPASRQLGATDNPSSLCADGYLCQECQQESCDDCGNLIIDYVINDGDLFCQDCYAKRINK